MRASFCTYQHETGRALHSAGEKDGLDVTVETCPHYVLFSFEDFLKRAAAKCAPPLRSEADKEELIGVLAEGLIDMVSSDHSPCHPSLKREDNMFLSWGGISGGQFTLLGMIQLAIDHGIPFEHVARWTAEAPAKRFGLTNKGRLEEDLTLILPSSGRNLLLSQKKRCFPNISKACMKATPFHTKLSRPTARDAVCIRMAAVSRAGLSEHS